MVQKEIDVLCSPFHFLLVTGPIFVIEIKTYRRIGNTGAKTVSSVAVEHHIIKQPTTLAIAQREPRVSDLN